MEKFNRPGGFGGETKVYYNRCLKGFDHYLDEVKEQLSGKIPIPFRNEPSVEYASNIIYAHRTGKVFRFNGNVANKGLITNLPNNCCVEVPCYADKMGIHPAYVGDLPEQLAALNRTNVNVQNLAAEAGLTGDREMVYHAVLMDPLTAAVLSPGEIRQMVDEMFEAEKSWLPQFKE